MFAFRTLFALASVASSAWALATPTKTESKINLERRGAVLTAQYATETEVSFRGRRFILGNNLWGEFADPSGSQSSQVTGVNGTSLAWHTTYSWSGAPTQVKSYANLDLRVGIGKKLASITSIPTSWQWTYTSASSDLVADVSYDLWLSKTAGTTGATSASTYEIMIWLSDRGGAGPAGTQVGTANINDLNWKLFKGVVASWNIFSFVAPSETTNFNQDLKPFFDYLVANQGVPSNQFLVQAQSGTEPFVGSATLTTASYSLAIN